MSDVLILYFAEKLKQVLRLSDCMAVPPKFNDALFLLGNVPRASNYVPFSLFKVLK